MPQPKRRVRSCLLALVLLTGAGFGILEFYIAPSIAPDISGFVGFRPNPATSQLSIAPQNTDIAAEERDRNIQRVCVWVEQDESELVYEMDLSSTGGARSHRLHFPQWDNESSWDWEGANVVSGNVRLRIETEFELVLGWTWHWRYETNSIEVPGSPGDEPDVEFSRSYLPRPWGSASE